MPNLPTPCRRCARVGAASAALLLALPAIAQPTMTQPNVWPPLRTPPRGVVPDDGEWRGVVGTALSLASGDTNSSTALLNASAVRATAQDRLSLAGSLSYGRGRDSQGVASTTAHKWATTAEYDWNLSDDWFTSLRGIGEANRIVGLNLRALVAPGVGYRVFADEESALSVYGGVAYTSERYSQPKTIGGRTDNRFDRFSLYVSEESRHRFGEAVTLSQRLEVYPGLTGDRALLVRFNASLGVSLTRSLQLNVGFLHSSNSRPPEGLRGSETSLFTGVNVRFGPR